MAAVELSSGWDSPARGVRSGEATPLGREARAGRISVVQEDLQLTSGQRAQRRGVGGGPPRESAAREALGAQPIAIAVIYEEPHRGRGTISKHEQSAREGIGVESLAADSGQSIDTFSKILRLNTDEDLELWDELDHDAERANEATSRSRTS